MHKLSTIFVIVKRALSPIRISAAKISVIKFVLAIIANLVTLDAVIHTDKNCAKLVSITEPLTFCHKYKPTFILHFHASPILH